MFPLTKIADGSYFDVVALPTGEYLASTGSVRDMPPLFEDRSASIWRISRNGRRSLFAGDTSKPAQDSGDGGPAEDAGFENIRAIARTTNGSVLLTDQEHFRRIDPSGIVSTIDETTGNLLDSTFIEALPGDRAFVYGTAVTWEFSGGGIAHWPYLLRQTSIVSPPPLPNQEPIQIYGGQIHEWANGSVMVAVAAENVVVSMTKGINSNYWHDSTTFQTVAAGTTQQGYTGDGGSPLLARLNHPVGLQALSNDAYVIGDTGNSAVRLIADGVISTIARGPVGPLHAGPAGLVTATSDGLYLLHKTQMVSAPRAFIDRRTASFGFTMYYPGDATYECQLDESDWSPCTSPFDADALEDGPHDFSVRATDATGTDPDPPVSHFVVDTTGPNTAITAHPAAISSSSHPSLAFDSPSDGATFSCRLVPDEFQPCTSPIDYTGLTDGPHTFEVKATTVDDHPDPTPAEFSWTVDTTPPTSAFTQTPPDHVAARSATFAFTSPDGGTSFACKLDTDPYAPCTSPQTRGSLLDGTHTFMVQATDEAGNLETSPPQSRWTVDPGPPETSLTSTPAAATRNTSAVFALAGDEPGATFRCAFDDVQLHDCSAAPAILNLSEGPHVFRAAARDLAGNDDPSPVEFRWIVDRTGPSAASPLLPGDGAAGVPSSVSLRFEAGADAGSGVSGHVVVLDDRPVATFGVGCGEAGCVVRPDAPLTDGRHRWHVVVTDLAGNETTSAERSFTVDATPPVGLVQTSPGDGERIGTATPALRWAAAGDPGSGVDYYEVAVDGGPATSVQGTEWSPPAALGDAVHSWSVTAVDHAGNRSGTAARSVRVDTTAPKAELAVSPARFVAPYTVDVDAGRSSDADGRIVRYDFDLDGDGVFEIASTSPVTTTTLTTPGPHTVGVRVTDEVGRTDTATAVATGEPPRRDVSAQSSFVSIDEGARFTRDLDVALSINAPPRAGATTMVISNDGRPDETQRIPIVTTISHWKLDAGDGLRDRRTVYVTFYNFAGFQVTNARVTDDILYDPRAPTIRSARLQPLSQKQAALRISAKDTGSGLAGFQLRSGTRRLAKGDHVRRRVVVRLSGRRMPRRVTLLVRDRAGNTARRTLTVTRR